MECVQSAEFHQFASCAQELKLQSLLCLHCDCGKEHCKVGNLSPLKEREGEAKREREK